MSQNIQTHFSSMPEMLSYIKERFFIEGDQGAGGDWSWGQRHHFDQNVKIAGWNYIGHGVSRVCFKKKSRNWVLKVPRCIRGIQDCLNEAAMFKARKGKFNPLVRKDWQGKLAPCQIVTISGVTCLIMEFLDCSETKNWSNSEFPKWTLQLMDGRQQLGKTKAGTLALYDYGSEVYEDWTPRVDRNHLEGLAHLVQRLIDQECIPDEVRN
jgi:hypothetical protein